MNDDLGEFVGKGFSLLRDRLKAVEARKALDGINGQDGKDGINGTDGADGTDGQNGINGIDGGNGSDGDNGTDGRDGSNGADGDDGADGKNGLDGDDGQDGTDGTNGINGTNGTDGKDATATDGKDGVGVDNTSVDKRGHLIVTLTDGREIDAGKLPKGKDGSQFHGMIAGGPSPKSSARVFFGSVDLIVGTVTVVHALELQNRNAFVQNVMVDNERIIVSVKSVDINTLELTSAVASAGASITVIGA